MGHRVLVVGLLLGLAVQVQAEQRFRGRVAPQLAGCRLRFLGAAGMVTGSMHMLEANGRRLLVDCGMRQGRDRRFETTIPDEAVRANAMLLTHAHIAHIDHSGDIPLLVKRGFTGKIHCTPGTAALCKILLIQQTKARRPRPGTRGTGRPSRATPSPTPSARSGSSRSTE